MRNLAHYSKSITALIGAVLTWAGASYIPTGHVNRADWFALAVALATAAGVHSVTNAPVLRKIANKPEPAPVVTPAPVTP